MKKIILLALAIVIAVFSATTAQTKKGTPSKATTGSTKVLPGKKPAVKWGPEYKAPRGTTIENIIGKDASGFYIEARDRSGDNFLEKYRNDLSQITSVEIDFRKDKVHKKREYEFTAFVGGKLYVFSSSNDKETKTNILWTQSVDLGSMMVKDDVRKIAEMPYRKKGDDGTFGYEISKDSTIFMIQYQQAKKKKESEEIGMQVYDSDMKRMWENEYTLPYEEELWEISDFKVDNNGNAYILGKLFKEKVKNERKGKPNYNYHIIAYTNGGKETKDYTINLPDKFITDCSFAINDSGNVITCGLYSNKGTYSIRGCFFMTIDARTREVTRSNSKDFGIDFITQYMSKSQEKKAKKREEKGKEQELYQYDLKDIVLRDDGGAVLIGEKYYVQVVTTSHTSNGVTYTTTTYYYHYEELFVVNMKPDGTIEWAMKIPKVQVTTNDGGFYSSYALCVVGDKLHFIFNDNPKNYNLDPGDRIKNLKGGKDMVVTHVTMDSEGKQTKESIFNVDQAEVIIRPKVCQQISDNQMLIFGQKKKTHRFAMLTFND